MGATIVIFGGSRLLGDPLVNLLPPDESGFSYGFSQVVYEREKRKLHLDDPVPIQYLYWLGGVLKGDLGYDLSNKRPIMPLIMERLPYTLELAGIGFVLATLIGIPMGVISAVKRGSLLDFIARVIAALGISTPTFWTGMLFILVFAVMLGWFPAGTRGDGFDIRYYVLPSSVLAIHALAGYLRLVRSSMLEILDSEFVKLARAKGVGNSTIVWKHAFRNALLVPLTYAGLLLAGFITGSVSVEVVFAWPGVANFGIQAAIANNLPVVVAVTLLFTALYIVIALLVDLLYALVDPRIRYG